MLRAPKTQVHLSKVYAVLASGIVAMILAGISQATLFTVPPQICVGLLLATLVMDIYVACKGGEKQNETTQKLSAVSFYLYGLLTGFLFGYGFTVLSDEEDKIVYAQILSAALIYTSAIFTVFSLFALLTTRRSVLISH